ncbi:MAG: hypothetical protein COV44_06995 [Deltaproteobacteria bacterium CG11_big_fil_rev_8_21_14_0_20_45_16]|nr:MAG: hypothetical protein COV44_06995 [Deltaproteobacteria bacterium CG11_big_fil_rev_8_21_14_0_20_45_16]
MSNPVDDSTTILAYAFKTNHDWLTPILLALILTRTLCKKRAWKTSGRITVFIEKPFIGPADIWRLCKFRRYNLTKRLGDMNLT